MYTILLNEDKSLYATNKTTLYQKENLADSIQFLIPKTYNGKDLTNCTIILKYKDLGNEVHIETLIKDTKIYKKNYIRCVLPIDSKLNRFASEINIRLSILDIDNDNGANYVLHSGEHVLNINPVNDYFSYANDIDGSLEKIDEMVADKLESYVNVIPSNSENGFDVIDLNSCCCTNTSILDNDFTSDGHTVIKF